MYHQYLGEYSKLVFLQGDRSLSNQILDKINESDSFDISNYNIVHSESKMDSKPKKTSLKGGKLKYGWIDKVVNKVPSLIVMSLDWSLQLEGVTFEERENSLYSALFDVRDKWKERNIKLILIIVLGNNYNHNISNEERLKSFKKNLDLENRQIFIVPGLDSIASQRKKLQQLIEEFSDKYYLDYLKKIKKRLSPNKPVDILTQEENLTVYLKMGFINEILKHNEKSNKAFNTAYQICQSLSNYYYNQADALLKNGDMNTVIQNIDFVFKNEENRYISDIIVLRLIQSLFLKSNVVDAFSLFKRHFDFYKNRVKYYDNRFDFEEYKWRSELFKYFGFVINRYYSKLQSIIFENNLVIRIWSIVTGQFNFSQQRERLFKDRNPVLPNKEEITIKKVEPIYFGTYMFKPIENPANPLENKTYFEKPESSRKYKELSLIYRLEEERNHKSLEERLEVLRRLEGMKILGKKGNLTIQSNLLESYWKMDDKENYKRLGKKFLLEFINTDWKTFYLRNSPFLCSTVLENLAQLAVKDDIADDIILYNLQLFLRKEEKNEEKLQRIDLIKEKSKLINVNRLFEENINRDMVNINIKFLQNEVKYYSNIDFQLTIRSKNSALFKLAEKLDIKFNNAEYDIQIQLNDCVSVSDDSFTKKFSIRVKPTFEGNIFNIKSFSLLSSIGSQNNFSVIDILFPVNDACINYDGFKSVRLSLPQPAIRVEVNSFCPVCSNELFDIKVRLLRNKDAIGKIKNVNLYLFDFDYDNKKQDDKKVELFIRENEKRTPYSSEMSLKIDDSQFERHDTDVMPIVFSIRNKDLGEKVFSIYVKYLISIDCDQEDAIIERDIIYKFNIEVVAPFMLKESAKVNSHYLNQYYKQTNINTKNQFIFPANNICTLNVVLSTLSCDIFIYSLECKTQSNANCQILNAPSFSNVEMKKNDSLQFNLLLKTNDITPNFNLGALDINWGRFDSKALKESNRTVLQLGDCCIDKRAFELDIIALDHCYLGDIVDLRVIMKNIFEQPQKFLLTLTDNDDFIISGDVKKTYFLATNEKIEFIFKLIPVNAGKLKIPGVIINRLTPSDRHLVFDSAGTRSITVIPKKLES